MNTIGSGPPFVIILSTRIPLRSGIKYALVSLDLLENLVAHLSGITKSKLKLSMNTPKLPRRMWRPITQRRCPQKHGLPYSE
jgi:hypothetical protein